MLKHLRVVPINLLSLYCFQAISSFMPLIVIPYLTRVLGPERFGAIAFYQALVAYGLVVLDYGFYVSALRDAARLKSDPSKLAHAYSAILKTKALLCALIFLAMLTLIATDRSVRREWLLFLVCGFQLLGNVTLPLWLFQGVEQARTLLLPQIASRAATMLLIFALVSSRVDTVVAGLLLSSSDFICSLLLIRAVRRLIDVRHANAGWRDIKRILGRDVPLFVISLGSNLCTIFNPVLIDVFFGHAGVAYYAISLRITTSISKITFPAIQSASPKLAVLVLDDVPSAVQLLGRWIIVLAGTSAAFGAAMFSFAPRVLDVFAGRDFQSAASVLRAFSPLPFLLVLSVLLGQNFAVHLGLSRKIAWIYWVVGIVNFCVLVPSIKLFGPTGAASTLVISEALIVAALIVLIRKHLQSNPTPGTTLDTLSS